MSSTPQRPTTGMESTVPKERAFQEAIAAAPEIDLGQIVHHQIPEQSLTEPESGKKVEIPEINVYTNDPSGPESLFAVYEPESGYIALGNEKRPRIHRQNLRNGDTYVYVIDITGIGRIVVLDRPADGLYHPPQDRWAISVGIVEGKPIIAANVADGKTSIPLSRYELPPRAVVYKTRGDDVFIVGTSEHYAAIGARLAAHQVYCPEQPERLIGEQLRRLDEIQIDIAVLEQRRRRLIMQSSSEQPEIQAEISALQSQIDQLTRTHLPVGQSTLQMTTTVVSQDRRSMTIIPLSLDVAKNLGRMRRGYMLSGRFAADEIPQVGNTQDLSNDGTLEKTERKVRIPDIVDLPGEAQATSLAEYRKQLEAHRSRALAQLQRSTVQGVAHLPGPNQSPTGILVIETDGFKPDGTKIPEMMALLDMQPAEIITSCRTTRFSEQDDGTRIIVRPYDKPTQTQTRPPLAAASRPTDSATTQGPPQPLEVRAGGPPPSSIREELILKPATARPETLSGSVPPPPPPPLLAPGAQSEMVPIAEPEPAPARQPAHPGIKNVEALLSSLEVQAGLLLPLLDELTLPNVLAANEPQHQSQVRELERIQARIATIQKENGGSLSQIQNAVTALMSKKRSPALNEPPKPVTAQARLKEAQALHRGLSAEVELTQLLESQINFQASTTATQSRFRRQVDHQTALAQRIMTRFRTASAVDLTPFVQQLQVADAIRQLQESLAQLPEQSAREASATIRVTVLGEKTLELPDARTFNFRALEQILDTLERIGALRYSRDILKGLAGLAQAIPQEGGTDQIVQQSGRIFAFIQDALVPGSISEKEVRSLLDIIEGKSSLASVTKGVTDLEQSLAELGRDMEQQFRLVSEMLKRKT